MIKPSNLFKNPEECSKLVLKKATNNIRIGYNKIIKGDLTYNELYKDPYEDDFLCCREYKSYVNNLITSHKIENCDFDHKNVLEYLREVALNEFDDSQPESEAQENEKNTCRDTFCDQCNVCLITQQGFNINK
ncbi:hypothetical protein NBO_1223g0001 [Nosema bombycis CQ1]|uniref:Uncharacterized protein n=1 Tax=Nosema bombycis (strain CQ1 / CVCC 102059) TaxID=578461 RepID=R0MBK7_NOSB1|nr:hypothetical protein NBO_1223g0001 [Nosema bombycis CQ1]|eukprot:EOB11390.1 hypothetical protein NBO_1223g0001 [Nosema bombycis CQ1]